MVFCFRVFTETFNGVIPEKGEGIYLSFASYVAASSRRLVRGDGKPIQQLDGSSLGPFGKVDLSPEYCKRNSTPKNAKVRRS